MSHRIEQKLSEGKKKLLLAGAGMLAVGLLNPPLIKAQSQSPTVDRPAPKKNLVGTWQGLMTVMAPDTRIVIKISTTLAGTLRGDLYSIDFGGHSPATDVTLKGSDVKIVIPSISGTYLGKMSADGKSITGIMKGRADDQPLNLTRATAETAWKFPEPRKPKMMPGDADPAFEVATVKPTNPDARGRGGSGFQLRGRQFSWINTSVGDLITLAYAIHPRQIVGAPDWVEKDRYDLMGEPNVEGQPNNRQEMGLIQKLLADRFSLRVHHEKRELSVFVIVIGKGGAKLSKAEDDPKAAGLTSGFPWEPSVFRMGPSSFFAQSATIADFVRYLVQREIFDRPVVDRTGLTGQYEFALSWRPEAAQVGGNNPPPPSGLDFLPDISTAFQQQLGLRLEATKTPTDVIVIDHVEKPSEN